MHFETRAIHAGQEPDPGYGAVMTPIYQTTNFAFKELGQPGPFEYTRSANPTRSALESCLASLEGGTRGFAFATGMAGIATVLNLLNAGDHIIVHADLYGGTYRLLSSVIAEKGVTVEFTNLRDLDTFRQAIRPNTKMIWTETPTNPLLHLLDLTAIAEIAQEKKILTVCDNTFATPCFQQPLSLGIDIALHSTTKYINGHSDVVGGAIVVKDAVIGKRIGFLQNSMGTAQAPFDSFLVLRGLKTLALRMQAHNQNALALAEWLSEHPKVDKVFHPGLKDHPQHDLALRQMTGFGGTFSFRPKGGKEVAARVLSSVRIFTLAESLGGVESLIGQPWTMSHGSMPADIKIASGITEDLIRLSVGIEHVDDLREDLREALG